MRILHVLGTARRIGGAEAYALDTALAQRERGNAVAVLHRDPDACIDLEHHCAVDGYEEWVASFAPDVVHVHGSALDLAVEARLQARGAVVRSLHDFSFACATGQQYLGNGDVCTRAHGAGCLTSIVARGCAHRTDLRPALASYRRIDRRLPLVRSAAATVVYSEFAREHAVRNGIDPARCRTIPYFATRAETPPPPSGERVVALAARLEVAERVEWLGWLEPEAMSAAIRRARVVALPSRWPEPFGIVGIEAMGQARAVVASRVGGIPEWLDDGETGRLVTADDTEALAGALAELVDDQGRAADLGLEGWRRSERFAPEVHLTALDELYAEVA